MWLHFWVYYLCMVVNMQSMMFFVRYPRSSCFYSWLLFDWLSCVIGGWKDPASVRERKFIYITKNKSNFNWWPRLKCKSSPSQSYLPARTHSLNRVRLDSDFLTGWYYDTEDIEVFIPLSDCFINFSHGKCNHSSEAVRSMLLISPADVNRRHTAHPACIYFAQADLRFSRLCSSFHPVSFISV